MPFTCPNFLTEASKNLGWRACCWAPPPDLHTCMKFKSKDVKIVINCH